MAWCINFILFFAPWIWSWVIFILMWVQLYRQDQISSLPSSASRAIPPFFKSMHLFLFFVSLCYIFALFPNLFLEWVYPNTLDITVWYIFKCVPSLSSDLLEWSELGYVIYLQMKSAFMSSLRAHTSDPQLIWLRRVCICAVALLSCVDITTSMWIWIVDRKYPSFPFATFAAVFFLFAAAIIFFYGSQLWNEILLTDQQSHSNTAASQSSTSEKLSVKMAWFYHFYRWTALAMCFVAVFELYGAISLLPLDTSRHYFPTLRTCDPSTASSLGSLSYCIWQIVFSLLAWTSWIGPVNTSLKYSSAEKIPSSSQLSKRASTAAPATVSPASPQSIIPLHVS